MYKHVALVVRLKRDSPFYALLNTKTCPKEGGIPFLYNRRASLSFDLFNDIVLDINHKLAGLLPPKADC